MSRPAPNPPKEHATPRIKIVKPDFEALRAKRDAAWTEMVEKAALEWGTTPDKVQTFGRPHGCYCACPDGPCEHQFAGWSEYETPEGGLVGTTVCKLCGMDAISHDMRCGP